MTSNRQGQTEKSVVSHNDSHRLLSIELEQFDIGMEVVCCNLMSQQAAQRQTQMQSIKNSNSKQTVKETNFDQKRSLLKSKSTSCSQATLDTNNSINSKDFLNRLRNQGTSRVKNVLNLRKDLTSSIDNNMVSEDQINTNDQNKQHIDLDSKCNDTGAIIRNHKERQLILDLVKALNETFMQSRKTCHLAIAYANYLLEFSDIFQIELQQPKFGSLRSQIFDIGFANSYLNKSKIKPHLVAASSVLMASKYFEIDDNLISISEIQKFLQTSKKIERQFRLSFSDVTQTELILLERMNWDLNFILPLDFAQVFCQILKQKIEDSQIHKNQNQSLKMVQFQNEVEKSLDKLMENYQEFQFELQAEVAFYMIIETINNYSSVDKEFASLLESKDVKQPFIQSVQDCRDKITNYYSNQINENHQTKYQIDQNKIDKIKSFVNKQTTKSFREAKKEEQDIVIENINLISNQSKDEIQIEIIDVDNEVINTDKQELAKEKHLNKLESKTKLKAIQQINEVSQMEIKQIQNLQEALQTMKKSGDNLDLETQQKIIDESHSRQKIHNDSSKKQFISDLRSYDASEMHSRRQKVSQTEMSNKNNGQFESKVDNISSIKLKSSTKKNSCISKPFQSQSHSSQIKDISPIYESDYIGGDKHSSLMEFDDPNIHKDQDNNNCQGGYSNYSPVEIEEDINFDILQTKTNNAQIRNQKGSQHLTYNQSKQSGYDEVSDNVSQQSKSIGANKLCMMSRQQNNVNLMNSRRGYFFSKNGLAEKVNDVQVNQIDSLNKQSKYAPIKKEYQQNKKCSELSDLQKNIFNDQQAQAAKVGNSTARQNSISTSLKTQCIISNLECSSTGKSYFIDSHRSENRNETQRYYTFSKDLNCALDKNSNFQNNLARKAHNLKDDKKNTLIQRNMTQRQDRQPLKDQAVIQRRTKYHPKNNVSSTSPQQISPIQTEHSTAENKKQKNHGLFKQVDAVHPASLKTFCEDLNISSNVELAHHPVASKNQNNKLQAVERLAYTRLAKKTGTVLGIRNNDGGAKIDNKHQSTLVRQQSYSKKVQNQTAMDRYRVKQTEDGQRQKCGLTVNGSQKQFTKCKSIYFDKNKQVNNLQQSQPEVSMKLLQNISNALSCEKLTIMDQYSKFNENKNSNKKKQYVGIQKQGTQQFRRFFKCDELSSPQAGGANTHTKMFEKRGSYNFQKQDDTISRVKNQGSFSLCMGSVNNKMKDKELDHKTVGHSIITADVKDDEKAQKTQSKLDFLHKVIKSDSQRQFHNHSKQKNLFTAKDNYLKTSHDSAYRAKEGLQSKNTTSQKKDHYLKILRAHNENHLHHSNKLEKGQKKRHAILSTSSTTPVGTESKLNYKSQETALQNKVLQNGRRKSNQEQIINQLYSPKSLINPLDSSKISGITIADKDFALKKSIAIDSNKGHQKQMSKNTSQKSMARQNSKLDHLQKMQQMDDNEINCNTNANTVDCDHYFTVTQQFDVSRSRTNQVISKQMSNTAASIKSNTSVRQKTSSTMSKKSNSLNRPDLVINTKKKPNNKQLGVFNSLSERQNIITPKQKTLNKLGNRVESSVDKKAIRSIHGSSKNLHPRSFKNKYESSQKKGEQSKKRYLDGSLARKQISPTAVKTQSQTKKMVVFSPSLKNEHKVIQYRNPFDSAGCQTKKIQNSRSRDKLGNCLQTCSDSTRKNQKESTFSATKLMSFVERRQINLNSEGAGKIDKGGQIKQSQDSDRQNFSSTTNQIKQTLRKFNLQSAEKLDRQPSELSQNGSARCLILNQHQNSRSNKALHTMQRSQSRRLVNGTQSSTNQQQTHNSEQQQQDSIQAKKQSVQMGGSIQSIVQRSQKLRQQIPGSESNSPQYQKRAFNNKQSKSRARDSSQPMQAGSEGAAPAYNLPNEVNLQQQLSARKYNPSNNNLTLSKQQTSSSKVELMLPKQIHSKTACKTANVISKFESNDSQQRIQMIKSRTKSNQSDLKLQSKFGDENIQMPKLNALQKLTDVVKFNESQDTSRTVQHQSQFTKSPINQSNSRQSHIPSTCESVTQYGIKQIESKMNTNKAGQQQPSIIQEAQDQLECEAAPCNLELTKAISQGHPGVVNLSSHDFKSKYFRNKMHLQQTNKTELITLTGREKNQSHAGQSWQSFSCNPLSADMQEDSSDGKKIINWQRHAADLEEEGGPAASKLLQQVQLEQQGSEELQKKTKKQRRTAQERKYQKRVPQHQQS